MRFNVSLADDAVQPFSSQARDFARHGKPGIEYAVTSFTHEDLRERGAPLPIKYFNGIHVIESLLYRDKSGKVRGILHHHANSLEPIAAEHEIQICVEGRFRRKHIATKLLIDALERWPIDLEAQRYTAAGAAFVRRFMNLPDDSNT